jgi:hypothetical protein
MSGTDIHAVDAPRSVRVDGEKTAAVVAALINGLYLAATPTFAVMALLTGMTGINADMMCSAAHGASPLSGMVPMYALMSAFHAGPWLKRIFGR